METQNYLQKNGDKCENVEREENKTSFQETIENNLIET